MRTGKLVWRFHTVPQPGEPGNDTWGPDGWKQRSGPSAWGLINVDVDRGLVLMSTGNPADSWYGGDRKGTNLYANCVLALDAATGKLKWHFQLTHHDIFDYDVPGGPALIQSNRKPVVAQITKMGFLFLLDETTGKPVFGVEERPVPKSDVPGEETLADAAVSREAAAARAHQHAARRTQQAHSGSGALLRGAVRQSKNR